MTSQCSGSLRRESGQTIRSWDTSLRSLFSSGHSTCASTIGIRRCTDDSIPEKTGHPERTDFPEQTGELDKKDFKASGKRMLTGSDVQIIKRMIAQEVQISKILDFLSTSSEDLFKDLEQKQVATVVKNLMLYPERFMCPLNKTLLDDPVIAADGQIYSRAAIQGYFKNPQSKFCNLTGLLYSPVTGKRIKNLVLYPCEQLNQSIKEFKKSRMSEILVLLPFLMKTKDYVSCRKLLKVADSLKESEETDVEVDILLYDFLMRLPEKMKSETGQTYASLLLQEERWQDLAARFEELYIVDYGHTFSFHELTMIYCAISQVDQENPSIVERRHKIVSEILYAKIVEETDMMRSYYQNLSNVKTFSEYMTRMKEIQDVYEHLWRNRELFSDPESQKGLIRILLYVASVQQSVGAEWDAFDTYTMCLDIDPSRTDAQQHAKRLQSKLNDSDNERTPGTTFGGIVSFIFEKPPPAYLIVILMIKLCATISMFHDFRNGRDSCVVWFRDFNVFGALWCVGWVLLCCVAWCKFEFSNSLRYDRDKAFHQERARSLEKILNRMVNRHMEIPEDIEEKISEKSSQK